MSFPLQRPRRVASHARQPPRRSWSLMPTLVSSIHLFIHPMTATPFCCTEERGPGPVRHCCRVCSSGRGNCEYVIPRGCLSSWNASSCTHRLLPFGAIVWCGRALVHFARSVVSSPPPMLGLREACRQGWQAGARRLRDNSVSKQATSALSRTSTFASPQARRRRRSQAKRKRGDCAAG